MPEVSVVISTYNRSQYLRASLQSALDQRNVDLEIIVVDNGSTDDTQAMLSTWPADPRVRVLRNEKSLGATGGRNTGLAAAAGEWIGILDDDDLWAPDKLRRQINAAQAVGAVWAYTGCVYIDRSNRIIGGIPPPTVEEVMALLPVRYALPGGMSSVVWQRGLLDADGLLDERFQLTTDWDLALRLYRLGAPAVARAPLVATRQHGANLSAQSGEHQAEFGIIAEKFADLLRGRSVERGGNLRFVGSENLRAGRRWAATKAYFSAVRAGDIGSLGRLAGVALPAAWHVPLRRWLLSDRAWMAQAQPWVRNIASTSVAGD